MLGKLPNPVRWLNFAPREWALGAKSWLLANGVWYATSTAAHIVALTGLLLVLGKVAAPRTEGEAPAFEAEVQTEIPQPELDHFDVGQTPLDPTELNTETLSLVDAPTIDTDQTAPDTGDALAGGGGGGTASGGLGGLDGFDVKAFGSGPLSRGTGLGASGGRGPGSGGTGSGFGARGDGAARKAMLGGYGGTKASERAVAAALNWLARHQNTDGSWSLDGYTQFCKGEPCVGAGNAKSDVAATAMALLPFLAAGQTHHSKGPYRSTIGAGINFLINRMRVTDGDLRDGGTMYTHGLAAITLCEAYGLNKQDSRVREAAQRAILFIEKSQIPGTGGWHYTVPPQATLGDTSIVGWQLMAIKSAQMAGLDWNEPTIDGTKKWLKSCTKSQTGGLFSYNPATPATPSMTSVGLLCTQYLGSTRNDPAIQEGMAYLMRNLPDANNRNAYYWYYATQVMHNVPGPEWDTWNRQMRRVLIDSQIKDGCAAGSWDPAKPKPDAWAEQGGRIMVTSLCCLTLEVYYRYLPLYKLDDDGRDADAKPATQAKK